MGVKWQQMVEKIDRELLEYLHYASIALIAARHIRRDFPMIAHDGLMISQNRRIGGWENYRRSLSAILWHKYIGSETFGYHSSGLRT